MSVGRRPNARVFGARTIAASLLAAAAVVAFGYGAMRLLDRPPQGLTVDAYGRGRALIVSGHVDQAEDGFVLIAGDSHAELAAPDPLSCGRKIVNAGLSGAKGDGYAAFLSRIALSHRPAVAVVTLGTNYLLSKRNPAGPAAADAYEKDLRQVVVALQKVSGRVVVAAVPPIAANLQRYADRQGVLNLTARQKAVCERLSCELSDPYASYREPDFNTAKPGATGDGLHLTDYRPAYRALDPLLCRAG